MKYLLDTDHLSILQRGTGDTYFNLSTRMASCARTDFGLSIVSFHEQFMGIHTNMNQPHKLDVVLTGYRRMINLLQSFSNFSVLPFDAEAMDVFADLKARPVKVATMDLRIASIALAQNLTVLTRNQRDFGKVPGLKLEDWTIAP